MRLHSSCWAVLGLLCGTLATPANAQTTHNVDLAGFSFTPADLTINLGDTVEWTWVSGLHNVVSTDGLFSSGSPVLPPMSFSITFDQAFLDSAPANGNVYNYQCDVHVALGMVGKVTVTTPNPVLTVNNLVAGSTASLVVSGATPNRPVGYAYSLVGPGPASMPVGPCGTMTVAIRPPVTILPLVNADVGGTATLNANIPAGIAGLKVWIQALDLSTCRLSNGATMVVG